MADGTRIGAPAQHRDPGTLRIGTIAGIDVLVRSSWLVVALLISVVLGPTISVFAPNLDGALSYLAGFLFAVLLSGSLLLHEMSHALASLRFGIPVRSITLHFLGGVTAIDGEPATPRQELVISGVGPITSLAVGGGCYALSLVMPDGLLWFVAAGLAWSNLIIGVLNLVPGIPLDGGRILRAWVWKVTGSPHRGTIVAGWSGRGVALLVLASPAFIGILGRPVAVTDYVFAIVLGYFLWAASSAAISSGRLRVRLPGLTARGVTRRASVLEETTSVARALEVAQNAQAGAIISLDQHGSVLGIVEEKSVAAVPPERTAHVTIGSVTRRLVPGATLKADLVGEELIMAMHRVSAPAYVVLEADGSIFGVLHRADIDVAFAKQTGRAKST